MRRRNANTKVPRATVPFGAQFLEYPRPDRPGPVEAWSWIPTVHIETGPEMESWPGTTGTGSTGREDERYGESQ